MSLLKVFAATCLLGITSGVLGRTAPEKSVRQNGTPEPLILVPGTERYWYPVNETRWIEFPEGAAVELVCQNGFNLFPTRNSITLECLYGENFQFLGQLIAFRVLSCTSYWLSSSRVTQERCFQDSVIVQVGFDLGANRWVNVFEVCHDEKLYHTHFVRHKMSRFNGGYQSGNPRPGWYQGNHYLDVNINNLYTVNKQRETIGEILGSTARADELVQNTDNGIYMARGHIAARVDFVYGTEQNATFWFLNAAPQWQNFNAINWERVESSVRNFVGQRHINLTVYSGTHGVLSLADGNGDYREIMLDFNPTEGTQRVPAPKLYYKILHDESANAGIAIVGVNNVHIPLEVVLRDYVVCEDIGDQVDWIDWERKNLTIGYSYACEVNEFNAAIGRPHPQLNVAKLLTGGAMRVVGLSLGIMYATLMLHGVLLFAHRGGA
ncbi:uncharacterized protein LOC128275682 [Anopheles cruzii]|uniref:uncharacterized protein LOC128275682 n=1 Tax=Anopheles cruzii TaxID=68878 RepID=UPI0022EC5165|nr:uncharacterized protein LOC128275682 [Anopheles cruzii]